MALLERKFRGGVFVSQHEMRVFSGASREASSERPFTSGMSLRSICPLSYIRMQLWHVRHRVRTRALV